MTKGKTVLLVVAVAVVALGAGLFLLLQNLDRLVEGAIETYGSQTTRTRVEVASVAIELRAGRGSIRGLTVANPPGFTQRDIFSLGEITLALDTASLTSDVPVIKEIRVAAPTLLFEVDAKGASNLARLKANLAQASAPAAKEEKKAAQDAGPRLRIQRLVVADGVGRLDLTAVGGKSWEIKVPAITLTDLGGKQGLTASQLSQRVSAALVKELERAATRGSVEQALRAKLAPAAGELQQRLDDQLGAGSSDALKSLLGR